MDLPSVKCIFSVPRWLFKGLMMPLFSLTVLQRDRKYISSEHVNEKQNKSLSMNLTKL